MNFIVKIFLIGILFFNNGIAFTQNNSFENYLIEIKLINKLYTEIEDTAYIEKIYLCKKINSSQNLELKFSWLADSFFHLGKKRKALRFQKKAFLYGAEKSYLDSTFYEHNKLRLDFLYKKYNYKYFKKLKDTGVKRILWEIYKKDQSIKNIINPNKEYSDSITDIYKHNLLILDSLTKIYDWIGNDVIGMYKIYKGNLFSSIITIIHSDENVNNRYLKKVVKSCEKGNESWNEAITIMQDQLWRFQNKNEYDYVKLRYIYAPIPIME